jgi:hypothetical protein
MPLLMREVALLTLTTNPNLLTGSTFFVDAAAFFLAGFFAGAASATDAADAAGASRGGRSASGAIFPTITATDSEGWAPWRIHFANFSAST